MIALKWRVKSVTDRQISVLVTVKDTVFCLFIYFVCLMLLFFHTKQSE